MTSNLVAHRKDIEQLLHVAGTAVANGYADYDPDTGTILGSVSFTISAIPLTIPVRRNRRGRKTQLP